MTGKPASNLESTAPARRRGPRIERLDPRIRPWIRAVFGYDPTGRRDHVAYPTGGTNVIACVERDGRHQEVTELIFIGLRTRPMPIPDRPGCTYVGIALCPGAAPALLGGGATELIDDCLPMFELDVRLRDRLTRTIESGEPATVSERVAAALPADLGTPAPVEPRVREAARWLSSRYSVGAVADHLGISRQHLGNLFRRHVGIGPKRFARMVRFRALLRAAQRHRDLQLADLAVRFGYSDQAHLHRDALEFAGSPPGRLIRRHRADAASG